MRNVLSNLIGGRLTKVASLPWRAHARLEQFAPHFSWWTSGVMTIILLSCIASAHLRSEQAIMCLGENLYHEGRGEGVENQKLIAKITLARVADPDRQWPKTICGAIAQNKAFSWVLDYRLATNRTEQKKWEEAQAVSRAVFDEVRSVGLYLPKGWECARFYKRGDDAGVSKRSSNFFGTLVPVQNGSFGHHTAYREKAKCKMPMPTA